MRRKVLLRKRFWAILCVFASLPFLGAGLLALEMRQVLVGMFYLTGGMAFLVIVLDGRLTRERVYSLRDTLMVLAGIPLMFLPILPMADYLIAWSPIAALLLGAMVLLAILAILEAWRSYKSTVGGS